MIGYIATFSRAGNGRLFAQSTYRVDGHRRLCGDLSPRRRYFLGRDQAGGGRSSAGLQGGLARNAAALGHPFALLVGFIAVEVWNNYDKAKVAVATEASALRAVVLLAENLPEEQKTRIYALIDRHIDEAVNKEWAAMARHRATLSTLRANALIETLHYTMTLTPADDSQRTAQSEMVKALHTALEARRQRIVVSQSAVGTVKWAGILLQGLCTLVAIGHGSQRQPTRRRHSDDPFRDGHCFVALVDRRLQSALYR